MDARRSFQVWAVPEASKNSERSLGFLHLDARAPGRWILKLENPELVKAISTLFVTVEPAAGGGKGPSGQKMRCAHLDEASHPQWPNTRPSRKHTSLSIMTVFMRPPRY